MLTQGCFDGFGDGTLDAFAVVGVPGSVVGRSSLGLGLGVLGRSKRLLDSGIGEVGFILAYLRLKLLGLVLKRLRLVVDLFEAGVGDGLRRIRTVSQRTSRWSLSCNWDLLTLTITFVSFSCHLRPLRGLRPRYEINFN